MFVPWVIILKVFHVLQNPFPNLLIMERLSSSYLQPFLSLFLFSFSPSFLFTSPASCTTWRVSHAPSRQRDTNTRLKETYLHNSSSLSPSEVPLSRNESLQDILLLEVRLQKRDLHGSSPLGSRLFFTCTAERHAIPLLWYELTLLMVSLWLLRCFFLCFQRTFIHGFSVPVPLIDTKRPDFTQTSHVTHQYRIFFRTH